MKSYTVVLLRPDYLCEEPYGQDIYVASRIMAEDQCAAVRHAQDEAFKADRKDGMQPRGRRDYALCVLFEGHHDPKLFGWQSY